MWRYLDNIRKKPEGVRNLYAFWGACLFTMIVIVIWSLSVPGRILAILSPTEPEEAPSSRFWSGILEQGADLRAGVVNAVSGGKDKEEAVSETEPITATTSQEPSNEEADDWVWSRPYENREGGRVIQIATSSAKAEVEERP